MQSERIRLYYTVRDEELLLEHIGASEHFFFSYLLLFMLIIIGASPNMSGSSGLIVPAV